MCPEKLDRLRAARSKVNDVHKLVIYCRKAQREVEEITAIRQQAFIKSHYEKK